MFMKRISRVAALAAVLTASAWNAMAAGSEPALIIRFNQPQVQFERPLYQVIERAVGIKSGVMFDVVAIAGEDSARPAANARAGEVIAAMNRMGVPASRISQSTMITAGSGNEVHVYAK